MSKPLTIGALSRDSGVNLETIRFYERSGLLPAPARSASGYRHYEEVDVRRLRFIRRGRELGFSLDEIRNLLDLAAHPQSPCDAADRMAREHLDAIETRIRDLLSMQAERANWLTATAVTPNTAVCSKRWTAVSAAAERWLR